MKVKTTPEEIAEQFEECKNVSIEFHNIFSKKDNFNTVMDFAKVDIIQLNMAMSGYYLLRSLQVIQLQRCINKYYVQQGQELKYLDADSKFKELTNKPKI